MRSRVARALSVLGVALFAFAGGACRDKSSSSEGATQGAASAASFVEVRPKPSEGSLAVVLGAHVEKAKALGYLPVVELGATWCGPCRELEASMSDARMQAAFKATYVVHLDVDAWGGSLGAVGLASPSIPVFIVLDEKGRGTKRRIDGSAWDDNVPANMAPKLDTFFHTKVSP